MHPVLLYYTEWLRCPKNHCAALTHPPPPPPRYLETTDLLTVFIILVPFPECHMVGFIQYAAFSDWRPSLSNMHSRFLHVYPGLGGSFLVITELSDAPPFVHSPAEGHLGFFSGDVGGHQLGRSQRCC